VCLGQDGWQIGDIWEDKGLDEDGQGYGGWFEEIGLFE
jgi:hypothetical protein